MHSNPSRPWINDKPKRKTAFNWRLSQDDAARKSGSKSIEDPKFAAILARKLAGERLAADLRSEKQWREHHESGIKKKWVSRGNYAKINQWLHETDPNRNP